MLKCNFDYKDYRMAGAKEDDTDASGIYSAFCVAYFAQTFCQNKALWFFEQ
jgi:hypothetical protein